ncbi:MAG: aspartate aminotransferase [Deltaproteobacteria bacterium CG_4_8_14_3_um_filter_45_9]|nr:MAG: aspartate aminotransferase [Deltaproteobacteria bacterium CG03_land_8_20_14_0_80_45_14]PIX21483.1 MAG: aspartate aminotransferase [Deltaproteobacteria bacterium CG_4_8_14_3_um_filter_45_9]
MNVLSNRAKSLKPSPTLAINAKAKSMQAQGIHVISFGAGEPDFDTPENIKQAAKKAIDEGFTKYTPVGGIDELKDAIIKKFQRDSHLTYKRSEIIVSCGGKHSFYNLAQAIFDQGDEVIIPAPYWVSYPPMVALANASPVIVETTEKNEFKITPEELKKAITPKTKAFILNSPSNPTGSAYSKKELEKIAEVSISKNFFVISDEIYEKIVYDGFEFTSIASLSDEIKKRTIIVHGVAKTYAMTGWRIGYTAGADEIISAMNNIQSQSTSNPTSIAQKASVEALIGSQSEVEKMVSAFGQRRNYIVDRLNKIPEVSCYKPAGAFYVFPNFSSYYGKSFQGKKIENSTHLADFFLDVARVAVVPGVEFGADPFERLSYATSMEDIKEGLNRIEEALNKLG